MLLSMIYQEIEHIVTLLGKQSIQEPDIFLRGNPTSVG